MRECRRIGWSACLQTVFRLGVLLWNSCHVDEARESQTASEDPGIFIDELLGVLLQLKRGTQSCFKSGKTAKGVGAVYA